MQITEFHECAARIAANVLSAESPTNIETLRRLELSHRIRAQAFRHRFAGSRVFATTERWISIIYTRALRLALAATA